MTTPTPQPLRITMTGTPVPVYMGSPDISGLVYNFDPTNTIYVGYTPNIQTGAPNTQMFPPGFGMTMNLSKTLYAIGPANSGPLQITPGGGAPFLQLTLSGLGGAKVFVQATAPTGTIPANSIWFDTANNSLQTWNGVAWVNQQLSAQQAIVAASITATQVQAGTLTTAQLAAAAGILGAQIANATITSTNIAANTIVAGNIAANTITAAQLAAGIIYAGIVNGTTINAATFVGGTFEGTDFVINSSGSFFYSGTPALGNLIFSSAGSAGTDGEGNAYVAGSAWYVYVSGHQIAVTVTNASGTPSLSFQDLTDPPFSPAAVFGAASNATAVLQMSSGQETSADVTALIALISEAASGALGHSLLELTAGEVRIVDGTLSLPSISAPASGSVDTVIYTNSNFSLMAIDNADGNTYNTQRLTINTTSGLTINSTSPIVIVTAAVATITYRLHICIVWQGGATASSAIIGGDGSCVVSDLAGILKVDRASTNAVTAVPVNQTSNFANRSMPFVASEFEVYEFDGIITFSTAGSFNIRGQETTSGDTWGVAIGSYMELEPVG